MVVWGGPPILLAKVRSDGPPFLDIQLSPAPPHRRSEPKAAQPTEAGLHPRPASLRVRHPRGQASKTLERQQHPCHSWDQRPSVTTAMPLIMP
jgi:hypothetical protein